MGLPIGLIPISGESHWSKKAGFISDNGTFKLHRYGDDILHSEDCISKIAYVFSSAIFHGSEFEIKVL